MTTRHMALAGAVAAVLGLSGGAFAQSTSPSATTPNLGPAGQPVTEQGQRSGGQAAGAPAQNVNPTPMPPGSRAGQAPGMGGGATGGAQQGGTAQTGNEPRIAPADPASPQGGRAAQTNPGATNPGASGPLPGSRQPAGTAGTQPGGAPMTGAPATGTTTPMAPAQGAGTTTPRTTPRGDARSDAAPLSGANSFTEGQARSRIEDNGYADVQALRLDEQGIWRGRAIRNGQPTGVALDYQGNIVATD
ncbi:hypothetical protein [Falsiroseomonas sp.]|uniref:hypothetical protein n=1 Tax=Falsiroseomonas sp. TaxID=2870721 RepID=UPI00271C2921|nr:hypothetical protein [Falsiroseomonas sp.]MDO9501657.1 hypothetical protein [Falsiroseomonas sp.]